MRRTAFAVMSTIAGLVGLLSFKTEASSVSTSTSAVGTTHSGTVNRSTYSATSKKSSTGTETVTGSVVNTQYGPVQVRITVTNGKVTRATAIEYPNSDPHSQQINAYAIPILEKETVGMSSASGVDMVSGATYTSTGYLQSLQSALDKM